jgi:hypothetical protein
MIISFWIFRNRNVSDSSCRCNQNMHPVWNNIAIYMWKNMVQPSDEVSLLPTTATCMGVVRLVGLGYGLAVGSCEHSLFSQVITLSWVIEIDYPIEVSFTKWLSSGVKIEAAGFFEMDVVCINMRVHSLIPVMLVHLPPQESQVSVPVSWFVQWETEVVPVWWKYWIWQHRIKHRIFR